VRRAECGVQSDNGNGERPSPRRPRSTQREAGQGTGGEETAKTADDGHRPGIGIRKRPTAGNRDSGTGVRDSRPVARGSPLATRHGFRAQPQKVYQCAAGTIGSSHAARARGNRGDRFPFLCLSKPRQGRLNRRSIAPEGAQRQRKMGVRVTVPRARAPWLLSSAPTWGLEQSRSQPGENRLCE